ncbi:hypothetical protein VNO80_24463 [Phaseolus coccineus]|uniref:Uncharacterized protein n=1 Tax=Phaseolus coccineus TaxID=3886 RepID=A0AAN9LTM7_PHACN
MTSKVLIRIELTLLNTQKINLSLRLALLESGQWPTCIRITYPFRGHVSDECSIFRYALWTNLKSTGLDCTVTTQKTCGLGFKTDCEVHSTVLSVHMIAPQVKKSC